MESKWFQHITLTKYIFAFLSKMIALHQNVANCQNTLTVLALRWRILLQDIWMRQMSMTDAGTTQDNFIVSAPPVGRMPSSRDWLDRMKLVSARTIPIILPSRKNNYIGRYNVSNQHRARQPWHETTLMQTWQQSLPFPYLQYKYG